MPPPHEGTRRGRMVAATVDQAFSSGSNFLLVFLLARQSTPTDLGITLIGYGIVTFALAISRASLGALLGMDLPRASVVDRQRLIGQSFAWGLTFSLLPAGILSLLAVGFHGRPTVAAVLLILAASAPVVLLQDLHRFMSIADARPGKALAADATWMFTCVVALTFDVVTSRSLSPAAGAAAWALGGLLGLLIFTASGQPMSFTWADLFTSPWADKRRRNLAADSLLGAAAPLVNGSASAIIAGPAITSAVRAAGTLFGPINVLGATVPLVIVPEAKRLPAHKVRRLISGLALVLVMAALGWGSVLLLVPDRWGFQVLGHTWVSAKHVFMWTTLEYAGLGLWCAAVAQFRINNATGVALRFRTAHALTTCTLPVVAVAIFHTAEAFAATLSVLGVALGLSAFYVARRAPTRGA
jgi:O-antigen/teichoic acid export membrane protein